MQSKSIVCLSITILLCCTVLLLFGCSAEAEYQVDNSGSNESDAIEDVQSSEESGRLFFNEDNVACLAQVDFQSVRNEDDGTIVITVPYDDYTARALDTTRTYVAVTKQGERLPEPDERLGTVEIDGVNEIDALRLESAQVIDNGSAIEFKGHVAGAKDFNSLFYAT